MNRHYLASVIASLVLATATAAAAEPTERPALRTEVKSFNLVGSLNGWHALDRESLVVWTSPSKAYLIQLQRPSFDLRHAEAIGLTSIAGRVSAGFDQVLVDGWRYQIKSIQALDADYARDLVSESRRA
jgi:hypothetical protein